MNTSAPSLPHFLEEKPPQLLHRQDQRQRTNAFSIDMKPLHDATFLFSYISFQQFTKQQTLPITSK